MTLARLFLAAVTISTLAACGDTVTAPESKATDAPPLKTVTCDGEWVTDSSGVTRCTGQIGSGG